MKNKKSNINFTLLVCGAAVMLGLCVSRVLTTEYKYAVAQRTDIPQATLVHQRAKPANDGSDMVTLGWYEPLMNKIVVCDLEEKDKSRLDTRMLEAVDYHETRHALHYYIAQKYRTGIGVGPVAAHDELFARTAENLAVYCDMPALPSGRVNTRINYSVNKNANLQSVATAVIGQALQDLTGDDDVLNSYLKKWSNMANAADTLKYKSLIDSMHVFKINGTDVDLAKLANADTQKKLQDFTRSVCMGRNGR